MGSALDYCHGFNTTRDIASGSNQACASGKHVPTTTTSNTLHVHGANVDLYTRPNTACWSMRRQMGMRRGGGLERLRRCRATMPRTIPLQPPRLFS